jgi:hypothetical protein
MAQDNKQPQSKSKALRCGACNSKLGGFVFWQNGKPLCPSISKCAKAQGAK